MQTKRPHLSVVKLLKNRVLPLPLTSPLQPQQMLDASHFRIAALVCQQQRNEIMKDFLVAVKSVLLVLTRLLFHRWFGTSPNAGAEL